MRPSSGGSAQRAELRLQHREAVTDANAPLWQDVLDETLAALRGVGKAVAGDFDVRSALREGDRAALERSGRRLFELLRGTAPFEGMVLLDLQGGTRFSATGDGFDGAPVDGNDEALLRAVGFRLPQGADATLSRVRVGHKTYSAASQPLGQGVVRLTPSDITPRVARAHRAELLAYGASAATLRGAALGLYAFMTRALRPVGEVVTAVRLIAEGDLSVPVRTDREDEMGQIKTALARVVTQLHGMVAEVRVVGDAVAGAADQLARIAAETSTDARRQPAGPPSPGAGRQRLHPSGRSLRRSGPPRPGSRPRSG